AAGEQDVAERLAIHRALVGDNPADTSGADDEDLRHRGRKLAHGGGVRAVRPDLRPDPQAGSSGSRSSRSSGSGAPGAMAWALASCAGDISTVDGRRAISASRLVVSGSSSVVVRDVSGGVDDFGMRAGPGPAGVGAAGSLADGLFAGGLFAADCL